MFCFWSTCIFSDLRYTVDFAKKKKFYIAQTCFTVNKVFLAPPSACILTAVTYNTTRFQWSIQSIWTEADKTTRKILSFIHFDPLCIYEYFNSITHHFCLFFFWKKIFILSFLSRRNCLLHSKIKCWLKCSHFSLANLVCFFLFLTSIQLSWYGCGIQNWPFRLY